MPTGEGLCMELTLENSVEYESTHLTKTNANSAVRTFVFVF